MRNLTRLLRGRLVPRRQSILWSQRQNLVRAQMPIRSELARVGSIAIRACLYMRLP
jgi:hypothetical protein